MVWKFHLCLALLGRWIFHLYLVGYAIFHFCLCDSWSGNSIYAWHYRAGGFSIFTWRGMQFFIFVFVMTHGLEIPFMLSITGLVDFLSLLGWACNFLFCLCDTRFWRFHFLVIFMFSRCLGASLPFQGRHSMDRFGLLGYVTVFDWLVIRFSVRVGFSLCHYV